MIAICPYVFDGSLKSQVVSKRHSCKFKFVLGVPSTRDEVFSKFEFEIRDLVSRNKIEEFGWGTFYPNLANKPVCYHYY